jgi:pimeloyl-ACP methyl ester carboxylesterase
MPPRDPVRAEAQRRRKQKQQALADLNQLAQQGIRLKRHVFFIPGWAGDEGHSWTRPYDNLLKNHHPMKEWARRIARTSGGGKPAKFLSFTLAESKACPTFYEFAQLLKRKILKNIPEGQPMDLVGHSMGGLDIIAAITEGPRPLRNVVNAIAVGSPLQGVFYGHLVRRVDTLLPFLRWDEHHHVQVRNLDKRAPAILKANSIAVRRRLLSRIHAFTDIRGTQDYVVMRSGRLRTKGLSESTRRRVRHLAVDGASHTGRSGLTQDPRTALFLFQILTR